VFECDGHKQGERAKGKEGQGLVVSRGIVVKLDRLTIVIAFAGKASRQRSTAAIPVMLSLCLALPRSRSLRVSRLGLNLRVFVLTALVDPVLGIMLINQPQLLVPVGNGGRLIIFDRAARIVERG